MKTKLSVILTILFVLTKAQICEGQQPSQLEFDRKFGLDGIMLKIEKRTAIFNSHLDDRKVIRWVEPGEHLWVQNKNLSKKYFLTCDPKTGDPNCWIKRDMGKQQYKFFIDTLTEKQMQKFVMADRLDRLFHTCATQGMVDETIEIGEKIKEARELSSCNDSPRYAYVLELLALQYREKGELDKAISYMTSARDIRKSMNSIFHPSYQFTLTALVALHISKGEHSEAKSHILKQLLVVAAQHGPVTSEYASCLGDAAYVFGTNDEFAKTKTFAAKALSIYKKLDISEGEDFKSASNYVQSLSKIKADDKVSKMLEQVDKQFRR
ncbi:tetratricopeptide repeat protein [Mariniblastus sp.]|nr:tetratricopeptide repeat protein [Mariniblastus sp.]